MRKQFRHLSSLEEAQAVLEELTLPERTTSVPLEEAHGRTVSDRIEAPIDVPGFDRSIMDGYAVQATDTVGAYDDDPVHLEVIDAVVPGQEPGVAVGEGQAIEIATGAVIPEGASAVVKVENTSRDEDMVAVHRPVAPQDHIMHRGADIAAGDTVLRSGERLDARRVGLLAALGLDAVDVVARPTVGIISTGGEIVRPTEADRLGPGEIFDINTFSLAAAIESAGAAAERFPHAQDDYDTIRSTFERAAASTDLVVSSGSTSASAEDVVYRVVEDAGELLLHGIAVKPGKPTVFGRLDGTPVLGMPGNPISALMNFRLFVRPLLDRALRQDSVGTGSCSATVAVEIDSVGGRTQLSPVGLIDDPDRGLLAYPVDKGSGAITSLADADGYLTIPEAVHYVAAGETATITLLDDRVSHPDALVAGDPCPLIDQAVDTTDSAIRYLDAGAIDGLRKLRDGVTDLAIVGAPAEATDRFDLRGTNRQLGYERRIGLLGQSPDAIGQATSGGTMATLPSQTGLAHHLDRLAGELGWNVDVRHYPSVTGLVEAVTSGGVDAALVDEASVPDADLTFEPVDWISMSILVASNRAGKTGVERLLDAIDADLASSPTGIRRPTED